MSRNVILFGWNRSIPGREQLSGDHFDEFVAFLGAKADAGAIQSFDVVLLDSHGGDLNGFFLIQGDTASLDALTASPEWTEHMTRATLHLEQAGVVTGVTGVEVAERMETWKKHGPA